MIAAGSGPNDGSIRFWTIPAGTLQRLIDPPEAGTGVSSLALSPDGRILVASYADGKVLRWSMSGGGAHAVSLSDEAGGITSLAFSPNGRLLAAGGADGRVYLWSVAGWRPAAPLTGPTQRVSSLAFSPDGSILAAASADDSVRLWDVSTGQPLGQPMLDPAGSPTSIAYAPDGTTIAVGSTDGMVRFWTASLPSWARQACRIANRNLTLQEWRQYLGDVPYQETCPGPRYDAP
jgi:WD40 repeat protein